MNYYVYNPGGADYGPFTIEQLRSKFVPGIYNPKVRAENSKDWCPLSERLSASGLQVPSAEYRAPSVPGHHPKRAAAPSPTYVTIGDIDIPFTRMVAFMVNWAFAAIPAMIIVWLIIIIGLALFGGLLLHR